MFRVRFYSDLLMVLVLQVLVLLFQILDHVLHVRKMITGGFAAGDHLANMQDMIKDVTSSYK